MQSDTTLLNKLAKQTNYLHMLTPEETVAMRQMLLTIYRDLAALCQAHGLRLMLCGGTCLGAVRHQGFIPWDDDLDVMMPRRDYEQLIKLLAEGAMGEEYEYTAPHPKKESTSVWLKIYRRGTLDLDLFYINAPFPKGIYIDVFALDGVPTNSMVRKCKGLVANGLQFCGILSMYAKYRNDKLETFMKMDTTLRRRYRLKCLLGSIVGLIPRRKWLWWFDTWVHDKNESGLMGIPTGRKYYNGEVFPSEVYLKMTEAKFETEQTRIPANYDAYLRNLYHDYMQLPPVEKRERHFIYQFATRVS